MQRVKALCKVRGSTGLNWLYSAHFTALLADQRIQLHKRLCYLSQMAVDSPKDTGTVILLLQVHVFNLHKE